jgi:hypothetical protein
VPPSRASAARPPDVSLAVRRILRDAARRLPELAHIDASRILPVLGEARRASRASIRPLHFADTGTRRSATGEMMRPRVKFRGRNVYYVITLRPLFFLESTPDRRIGTILHEVFHCAETFDGTLHPGRRHAVLGPDFDAQLGPLVNRYLAVMPDRLWETMAVSGPVRVRMWLEKPSLSSVRVTADGRRVVRGRQVYTEAQTFLTTIRMKTAASDRRRR